MALGSGTVLASSVLASSAFAPPVLAAPVSASPTDQAGLRQQALTLASAIRQQGLQLDVLAERVDQARLHATQVAADAAATTARVTSTNGQIGTTLRLVRTQAMNAYVGLDRRSVPILKGMEGANALARRQAYADTVAATKTDALRHLRLLRQQLAAEEARLASDQQAAQAALDEVTASREAAARQAASQQVTLSQVQGQLAVLVQAEQARLAAEEAAQVQARLRLMAATPATTRPPAAPARSTQPTPRPPAPSPVAAPPTSGRPSPPVRPPPPTTAPPSPARPGPGGNTPAAGAQTAIAAAEAQLGKPYLWGGAGPDSFDCSGLVSWAWAAAGVYLPHLAQLQYDLTRRVAISDLLPGDLVFYGTPSSVYHVGIYVGGGRMIDAPTTGQVVHYAGIYFSGLLAGGRVING
jgi:cell wall-associated NlpC family hydrolase